MPTVFARINNMDKAVWEYIKMVSKAQNKTIPAFITDMVENHAIQNNRVNLLKTLKEDFSQPEKK